MGHREGCEFAEVHFHNFDLDVSTTDETVSVEYPMKHANTYFVHDIIRMANLPMEEVIENGAILSLNMVYDCELDLPKVCRDKLTVTNIDTQTGFNHVWNNYYYEDGKRKRDTYRMYGLRFVVFATGLGHQISTARIVLQFATFMSMSTVAMTLSDLVLQFLIAERASYKAQKVQETEDFND